MFVFLQPSLRSQILPQQSTSLLNTFAKETAQNKELDPRLFWETREFYAPGSFELKKGGFSETEFKTILQNMHTEIHMTGAHPFLTFNSDKWKSVEVLIPTTKITDVIKSPKQDSKEIIFESDSELVYYTNNNTMKIIFIKPVSIMKNTNGFLDYGEYDLDILKDKNWLVISEVEL